MTAQKEFSMFIRDLGYAESLPSLDQSTLEELRNEIVSQCQNNEDCKKQKFLELVKKFKELDQLSPQQKDELIMQLLALWLELDLTAKIQKELEELKRAINSSEEPLQTEEADGENPERASSNPFFDGTVLEKFDNDEISPEEVLMYAVDVVLSNPKYQQAFVKMVQNPELVKDCDGKINCILENALLAGFANKDGTANNNYIALEKALKNLDPKEKEEILGKLYESVAIANAVDEIMEAYIKSLTQQEGQTDMENLDWDEIFEKEGTVGVVKRTYEIVQDWLKGGLKWTGLKDANAQKWSQWITLGGTVIGAWLALQKVIWPNVKKGWKKFWDLHWTTKIGIVGGLWLIRDIAHDRGATLDWFKTLLFGEEGANMEIEESSPEKDIFYLDSVLVAVLPSDKSLEELKGEGFIIYNSQTKKYEINWDMIKDHPLVQTLLKTKYKGNEEAFKKDLNQTINSLIKIVNQNDDLSEKSKLKDIVAQKWRMAGELKMMISPTQWSRLKEIGKSAQVHAIILEFERGEITFEQAKAEIQKLLEGLGDDEGGSGDGETSPSNNGGGAAFGSSTTAGSAGVVAGTAVADRSGNSSQSSSGEAPSAKPSSTQKSDQGQEQEGQGGSQTQRVEGDGEGQEEAETPPSGNKGEGTRKEAIVGKNNETIEKKTQILKKYISTKLDEYGITGNEHDDLILDLLVLTAAYVDKYSLEDLKKMVDEYLTNQYGKELIAFNIFSALKQGKEAPNVFDVYDDKNIKWYDLDNSLDFFKKYLDKVEANLGDREMAGIGLKMEALDSITLLLLAKLSTKADLRGLKCIDGELCLKKQNALKVELISALKSGDKEALAHIFQKRVNLIKEFFGKIDKSKVLIIEELLNNIADKQTENKDAFESLLKDIFRLEAQLIQLLEDKDLGISFFSQFVNMPRIDESLINEYLLKSECLRLDVNCASEELREWKKSLSHSQEFSLNRTEIIFDEEQLKSLKNTFLETRIFGVSVKELVEDGLLSQSRLDGIINTSLLKASVRFPNYFEEDTVREWVEEEIRKTTNIKDEKQIEEETQKRVREIKEATFAALVVGRMIEELIRDLSANRDKWERFKNMVDIKYPGAKDFLEWLKNKIRKEDMSVAVMLGSLVLGGAAGELAGMALVALGSRIKWIANGVEAVQLGASRGNTLSSLGYSFLKHMVSGRRIGWAIGFSGGTRFGSGFLGGEGGLISKFKEGVGEVWEVDTLKDMAGNYLFFSLLEGVRPFVKEQARRVILNRSKLQNHQWMQRITIEGLTVAGTAAGVGAGSVAIDLALDGERPDREELTTMVAMAVVFGLMHGSNRVILSKKETKWSVGIPQIEKMAGNSGDNVLFSLTKHYGGRIPMKTELSGGKVAEFFMREGNTDIAFVAKVPGRGEAEIIIPKSDISKLSDATYRANLLNTSGISNAYRRKWEEVLENVANGKVMAEVPKKWVYPDLFELRFIEKKFLDSGATRRNLGSITVGGETYSATIVKDGDIAKLKVVKPGGASGPGHKSSVNPTNKVDMLDVPLNSDWRKELAPLISDETERLEFVLKLKEALRGKTFAKFEPGEAILLDGGVQVSKEGSGEYFVKYKDINKRDYRTKKVEDLVKYLEQEGILFKELKGFLKRSGWTNKTIRDLLDDKTKKAIDSLGKAGKGMKDRLLKPAGKAIENWWKIFWEKTDWKTKATLIGDILGMVGLYRDRDRNLEDLGFGIAGAGLGLYWGKGAIGKISGSIGGALAAVAIKDIVHMVWRKVQSEREKQEINMPFDN